MFTCEKLKIKHRMQIQNLHTAWNSCIYEHRQRQRVPKFVFFVSATRIQPWAELILTLIVWVFTKECLHAIKLYAHAMPAIRWVLVIKLKSWRMLGMRGNGREAERVPCSLTSKLPFAGGHYPPFRNPTDLRQRGSAVSYLARHALWYRSVIRKFYRIYQKLRHNREYHSTHFMNSSRMVPKSDHFDHKPFKCNHFCPCLATLCHYLPLFSHFFRFKMSAMASGNVPRHNPTDLWRERCNIGPLITDQIREICRSRWILDSSLWSQLDQWCQITRELVVSEHL